MKKWWLNFVNRMNPWICVICDRESRDWEDRIKFVGRYVWGTAGVYEGKTEEMYCPEHKDWMPMPQGSQEARRRYYSGESQ